MSNKFVFNPLSGKFDLVPDVSSFVVATPTNMQADLRIGDHTQMLCRDPVVAGVDMTMYVGEDAALIQV